MPRIGLKVGSGFFAPTMRWLARSLLLAVLLWISVGATLVQSSDPSRASAGGVIWPWAARPAVLYAERLVSGGGADAPQVALATAGDALRREPVNVEAVRAMAVASARLGDAAQADQWFRFSEVLSRRDLATQMWKIEKAVATDDIDSALVHYDRALRTSKEAADILLPVLRSAANDPAVAESLGKVLGERPAWAISFLASAIPTMTSASAILVLMRHYNAEMADGYDRWIGELALARLIALRAFDEANRLYSGLAGDARWGRGLLHNGDFESGIGLRPLAWSYREDYEVNAFREKWQGENVVLKLHSRGGRGGLFASQTLLLKAGKYILSGTAGGTGTDRASLPRFRISCQGGDSAQAELVMPAAEEQAANFSRQFVVADNCDFQIIEILSAPAADTDAWVDNLEIRRLD